MWESHVQLNYKQRPVGRPGRCGPNGTTFEPLLQRRLFGDVNLDSEFTGDFCQPSSDVALRPEPQLSAVMESRSECFGDKPAGSAETCSDSRSFVEVRTWVEYLENVRMWSSDDVSIRFWQPTKQLTQLSGAGRVKSLQKSPVCRDWYP